MSGHRCIRETISDTGEATAGTSIADGATPSPSVAAALFLPELQATTRPR